MNGKVLLVTRDNLARIVAEVAPEMLLVQRANFVKVATDMLTIIETVNVEQPVKR